MWQNVWPGIPVQDTPIGSITNGVHVPSWVSRDMVGLFERYLGPRWKDDVSENALWSFVHRIPDEEFGGRMNGGGSGLSHLPVSGSILNLNLEERCAMKLPSVGSFSTPMH